MTDDDKPQGILVPSWMGVNFSEQLEADLRHHLRIHHALTIRQRQFRTETRKKALPIYWFEIVRAKLARVVYELSMALTVYPDRNRYIKVWTETEVEHAERVSKMEKVTFIKVTEP